MSAARPRHAGLRYDDSVHGLRLLFIFVDGLGLGEDDPAGNPVVRAVTPALRALAGGPLAGHTPRRSATGMLVPLDACLGVPGLPQSATGQTALLTGQNAPAYIGRHLTAYPTPSLAALLASHGMMGILRRRGLSVAVANAYTPAYFEAVAARRLRHGAITLHALQAGVRLRTVDDLAAGRAVYQDLTNARARDAGADVPVITPEEAGRNLAGIAREHAFTIFEFFQTDLAGHRRIEGAVEVIERLDRFVGAAVAHADLATTLVVLTSDHGNIEDARTRAHTTNPVPALFIGAGRDLIRDRLHAITDVAPACLALLTDAGEAVTPSARGRTGSRRRPGTAAAP
jgi:2,3-bisphosphoglycerate-independent phosphoglycerate mutase